MDTTTKSVVAVVVPAYNEQRLIADTIAALERQHFDSLLQREVLGGFRVIVVDNASTDDTAAVVRQIIDATPAVPVELVTESEKGTGCAADTGVRHAIDTGAVYIARTDADSVPAPDWLGTLLTPLLDGKRLVGGRIRARGDEGYRSRVFNAIGVLWRLGHAAEWYRTRKEPDALRRSFAICGNNMAIDAEIYERSGGFPRGSIEHIDEDHVLQQRVRAITGAKGIALAKRALVYTSLRRLNAYGTRDFVSWYNEGKEDRPSIGHSADVR